MIYVYTLWSKVYPYLLKELPRDSIRNLTDYNKVEKRVTPNDLLFFLQFGKGSRTLQRRLYERGLRMFPNPAFSLWISERSRYLPEVDTLTAFPLHREYYENASAIAISPKLPDFVTVDGAVLKVGNYHCGQNKFLLRGLRDLPYLPYKLRSEPVVLEEFVAVEGSPSTEARSIRVGFINVREKLEQRDPTWTDNIYLTEHVNSRTWIKNDGPVETSYLYNERYALGIENIDNVIEDARRLALHYQADLLGADYVISDNRIGLLELNDMIGIPDDNVQTKFEYNRILDLFQRELLAVCLRYLNRNDQR